MTILKNFSLCLLLGVCIPTLAQEAPAFPGAEGFARYTTTGGRGGKIVHVTILNDDGPGSLRQALGISGPRTIVFDVSGIIELQSTLKVNKGDVSILGQTAPGDGICLKNYTFRINADNVIVRFIRCRMGDEAKTEDDAMNAFFHSDNTKKNIIIDHCSLSWCTDECGTFYGINNFTLQWCILSESLRNSVHDKGAHGYGGIWGGAKALYHHNLVAHHDSRNPRFDHDYVNTLRGPLDYINNVVYNWGSNSSYGGEAANETNAYKTINMINNYYKPGPATLKNKSLLCQPYTKCKNCVKAMGTATIVPAHFFISGNYMYGSSAVTNDNWKGVKPQDPTGKEAIKSETRFLAADGTKDIMTMHSAETAYEKVLAFAGASYKRDAVDARVVEETKNGTFTYSGSNGSTGGLIDTQSDVGGWPCYASTLKPTDTDNDGIPDAWEKANGLNPDDPTDASAYSIDPKGYYTNIEVYANSLVQDIIKAENADAEEPVDEYYPATKSK